MARILVNYTYNKAKDEYKILDYSCGVFENMKIAVLDTEDDIKIPIVVPINNTMTVVDKERYEIVHKRFYLVSDEHGKISEHPNGHPVWLPKDTDVSKLRVINGQIVMIEEEPAKETDEKIVEESPVEEKKETKHKKQRTEA